MTHTPTLTTDDADTVTGTDYGTDSDAYTRTHTVTDGADPATDTDSGTDGDAYTQ